MTLEDELALSFYSEVATIDAEHGIFLVQDTRSRKIYVKKVLQVYSLEVYRRLLRCPILNTPRILHAVEADGTLTVIEEYIPGDTLEEILAKGPLPETQVVAIATALCDILSDFHACDPPIVNRDIKPSNIKITPDGAVKLVDLNAAKAYDPNEVRDTVLLGTQGYAAPEQYGFGASSILTDLYALGVLMNVMLTGALPGVCPAGGRLQPIIAACTELTPARRFQSAAQVKRALKTLSPNPQRRGWLRFLPPGFRNRNPFKWLLAILGYAFALFICAGIEVEGASAIVLHLNRIGVTAALLLMILFSGNYLDVQRFVPFGKSRNLILRILAVAITDALLFSAVILLILLLENRISG